MSCTGKGGPRGPTGRPNANNPANPNATNPLKFPGLTPPRKPTASAKKGVFKPKHRDQLDKLSKNCYKNLHKPMVIKVLGHEGLWYVCEDCLKKWLDSKGHKKLKQVVIGYPR